MTNVLDHGEVILVDSMAYDGKVVNAARISTGKEHLDELIEGRGYRLVTEAEQAKDVRLINFLMSNGHGTPFEHAVFQFYIKCPIFVAREWQRHRIASYNEFSMRYAEVPDDNAEFYVPDHVRVQDPNNKQSSIRVKPDSPRTVALMTAHTLGVEAADKYAFDIYRQFIANGVAREMARIVLPVNIYTRFWFTVNARSLMNFLMLRNAPGALWEIQEYARAIESIFAEKMPATYEAFVANGRRAP